MMRWAPIEDRLNRLLLGPQVFGLEVQLVAREKQRLYLARLKRRGASVDIEAVSQPATAEEVIAAVGSRPLHVCVTGKGIITRRMEDGSDLQRLFPSLRLDEMTCRMYGQPSSRWVSIARTAMLDQCLEPFHRAGCKIVRLELGGTSLLLNTALFADAPEALGAHRYEWAGGDLAAYEFNPEGNGEEGVRFFDHPVEHALSMLCAIGFFARSIREGLQDRAGLLFPFLLFRVRQFTGMAFGAALFVALVLSFVAIRTSQHSATALGQEIDLLRQRASLVKDRDQEQVADANLYRSIHHRSGYSQAEMLEGIARVVPASIRLGRVSVFPRERQRGRRRGPIGYERSAVEVGGSASQMDRFTGFVNDLAKLEWVKEVKMISLVRNEREGGHDFQLSLVL